MATRQRRIPQDRRGGTTYICWIVFLLLSTRIAHAHSAVTNRLLGTVYSPLSAVSQQQPTPLSRLPVDWIRGGSQQDSEDEEEEEEKLSDADEEEEEEEEEDESTAAAVLKKPMAQRILGGVGTLMIKSVRMNLRVLRAVFSKDEEEAEDTSFLAKMGRTYVRMWKAAFSPETVAIGKPAAAKKRSVTEKEKASATDSSLSNADLGAFLAKSYHAEATRESLDSPTAVLAGTISDALKYARSEARLLLVLIPATRPEKSKQADQQAIESFLSAEVATVADAKARKKGDLPTGSFVLWSARAGSPEAVVAMKRLKAQPVVNKGQKGPILLVAYPSQVNDRGQVKVIPKLLAQHHCNPPPSAVQMAAWLNALRKRHAKQYLTMQEQRKELELFQERKQGYKDSMQSDTERQEREKREAQERLEKEKAEQERIEALQKRREELLASLPEEPSNEETEAKTIALRFADGRSAQRRFSSSTDLATVFNWVDATFEMERETILLTTLNGRKSFSWTDSGVTLAESGLSRMTGFRVTEAKEDLKEDPSTPPDTEG